MSYNTVLHSHTNRFGQDSNVVLSCRCRAAQCERRTILHLSLMNSIDKIRRACNMKILDLEWAVFCFEEDYQQCIWCRRNIWLETLAFLNGPNTYGTLFMTTHPIDGKLNFVLYSLLLEESLVGEESKLCIICSQVNQHSSQHKFIFSNWQTSKKPKY